MPAHRARFAHFRSGQACAGAALALAAGAGSPAYAGDPALRILHAFTGGQDGASPNTGLVADKAGNLYGTTSVGNRSFGAVFKLAPDGTLTTLHTFVGGADGGYSLATLVRDKAGNLYGTTAQGGISGSCQGSGCGVVFKLAPDGTYSVLHTFTGGSDGGYPVAGVIRDGSGNLYGTTFLGGQNCGIEDCGVVFKLAPDGTETVLHTFTGGKDGGQPEASLIRDRAGNLYGTAASGGAGSNGVVFEIGTGGKFAVLHAFAGGSDGGFPEASLTFDKAGNLYGTSSGASGQWGTVFKIAATHAYTLLYDFTGSNDGGAPAGGVLVGGKGNLYGTTLFGGAYTNGVVFKLAPDGTETVLHAFTGGAGGATPGGNLLIDPAVGGGKLYGTACCNGAYQGGIVYEIGK